MYSLWHGAIRTTRPWQSRRNRATPWNVLAGTGMQQRRPPFNPPHTAFEPPHCRLRLPLHHGQMHG
ncbi:hypothetical protein B0T18DRAFT_412672 [Schizothecium vesticola]|uniref:Uncharacterized protein n=1 Tax=Schizothecium vesticola TaxID=314040 RepID=A0AA40EX17_9PEZI|nr:hypothetical protein B0T18DRAFT_412672 [Schizothecium vesticola]